MSFLIGFLIVLLVLVSILLVLIVLVQDDGAQGAGMLFGSSASQQYGARRGNIVTRTTGILAGSFICISLILVFLFKERESNLQAMEATTLEETQDEKTLEWWQDPEEAANAEGDENEFVDAEGAAVDEGTEEPESSNDEGETPVAPKDEVPAEQEVGEAAVPAAEITETSDSVGGDAQ